MPNYAASALKAGQTMVSAKYNTPEQRRKNPTVLGLALSNEKNIPNVSELRKSANRTVEISYFTNVAPGSATSKASAHTGTYGDTGMITLAWVTHVETMSLPRKIGQNNVASYQEIFNNLYEIKWRNLLKRHDDSALAFLKANRLQRSAAIINPLIASANPGVWDETLYGLILDGSNKPRMAQKMKSFMKALLYDAPAYDVIADLQMSDDLEFLRAQGAGNNTNTQAITNGLRVATTQDVVDANMTGGGGLIMPQGMFAGYSWNDPLNRAGRIDSGETEVGMLGTVADPFGFGAVADISTYTKRADTSADTTSGSTQDIVDQYELTLTVAYALPPLSVAGDSVLSLVGSQV
ncbi:MULTISPECIES: hypothetical protein [unclassified Paraflavitalea]|uniref:hypothetical protein n=1 Tax=unclassified Paraflavitalea TaxID=2798305 RepID=UPI003D32B5E0